jgi:hypothetical protein
MANGKEVENATEGVSCHVRCVAYIMAFLCDVT